MAGSVQNLATESENAMQSMLMTRHEASWAMELVAEDGKYGSHPTEVSAKRLGRALCVLLANFPEEDPLSDLIAGYREIELDSSRI